MEYVVPVAHAVYVAKAGARAAVEVARSAGTEAGFCIDCLEPYPAPAGPRLQWSPDGKRLALLDNGRLYVFDPDHPVREEKHRE